MKNKIKPNKLLFSKKVKIFKKIIELKWELNKEIFKLLNKTIKKCKISVLKKLPSYKMLLTKLKVNWNKLKREDNF